MPGKNVNLSMHKMNSNFRSKLNFAQCIKQIYTHTHTQTIRVHSQKKKKKRKKKYSTRRLSGGIVDDVSVLLGVSPLWN
jgi:hypothetical protein